MSRISIRLSRELILCVVLSLIVVLTGCGGSSPGSADNANIHPSTTSLSLTLRASHIVANIGGSVALTAIVRDINGNAVANVPVYFAVKSGTGVLTNSTAISNNAGLIDVLLSSPVGGFVSVIGSLSVPTIASSGRGRLAVPSGVQEARAVVYFTNRIQDSPSIVMSVDGDNNGVFDESEDFSMVPDGIDALTVKSRLVDIAGLPMRQKLIQFYADSPYVSFLKDFNALTDDNGEALTVITASAGILDEKIPGVTIYAGNDATGAVGAVTVYFETINVGSVLLSANPPSVQTGGKATITVWVLSESGHPMPDGTVVTLTSSGGSIDPVVILSGGTSTATFTAPGTAGTVSITGSAGGKQSSTSVEVTAPPSKTSHLNIPGPRESSFALLECIYIRHQIGMTESMTDSVCPFDSSVEVPHV